MGSENDKGVVELDVFREFAKWSPLEIDVESLEKRVGQSEPDILCLVVNEGPVAFELVEICDSTIAALPSTLRHGESTSSWTSDPTTEIIRHKLHKIYKTQAPVELLCYSRGRVVTADDDIIEELRRWTNAIDGPFRRVWFLGESGVHEVWCR